MSPSKRKAEKQTSDGKKKAKVSPPPLAPAGINADVWVKHRENVQIVVHDPKFSPCDKNDPLGITASGSSGHIAPFDKGIDLRSLTSTQNHMCAVNVF